MEEQKPPQGEGAANTENKGTGADDQGQGKKSQEGGGMPEFKVPRRGAEYWDAAQKRREAQRARADFFKSKEKPEGDGGGEGEGAEDDAPLTKKEYARLREQDRLLMQEEFDKKAMSQSDEIAINSFLAENPKFKKFEKEGRAVLKDPAYTHADISLIFRGLAYEDAQAEGAKKGAKANETASRNSAGGSGRRQEPESTGYDPAKHKDFKKKLASGKVSFGSPE